MNKTTPVEVLRTKEAVQERIQSARDEGGRIALVPTMGYLHEGHLALIDRARDLADWVAVSIFVNPLQFGPTEDLERYPRDLDRDIQHVSERGGEVVFAPTVKEMYPGGEPWITVVPGRGADVLCGASRPGHFAGVLTVVAKLFGIFRPDTAVFGQKDLQQVVLVRRMVYDLDMPVDIEVVATIREPDGLAMSSRNAYLTPAERKQALALSRGLGRAAELFAAGETDPEVLKTTMRNGLATGGVVAEYAEVVDPLTLAPLDRARAGAACAIAARVGQTRLIDNMILGNRDLGGWQAASGADQPVGA